MSRSTPAYWSATASSCPGATAPERRRAPVLCVPVLVHPRESTVVRFSTPGARAALTRRQLLRAGGLGVVGFGAAPSLASCRIGGGTKSGGSGASRSVDL